MAGKVKVPILCSLVLLFSHQIRNLKDCKNTHTKDILRAGYVEVTYEDYLDDTNS